MEEYLDAMLLATKYLLFTHNLIFCFFIFYFFKSVTFTTLESHIPSLLTHKNTSSNAQLSPLSFVANEVGCVISNLLRVLINKSIVVIIRKAAMKMKILRPVIL